MNILAWFIQLIYEIKMRMDTIQLNKLMFLRI